MKEPQVMEDALETYSSGRDTVAYIIIIMFIVSFSCGFAGGMVYARLL